MIVAKVSVTGMDASAASYGRSTPVDELATSSRTWGTCLVIASTGRAPNHEAGLLRAIRSRARGNSTILAAIAQALRARFDAGLVDALSCPSR